LKKKHEPWYWDISLEKIVLEVLRETGIPRDQVYSLTRGRKGALGRHLAAYLARKLAGFRVIEVARHFHREPMTLSLGVKKVESLLQNDKALAKKVEIMERNLTEKSKKKYFITIA
jgi:chromosomal replication initiation ATPase DnaA